MDRELCNRVNIPLPGAVSCVRISFSSITDTNIKTLLMENEKVLQVIESEILQTEMEVLLKLLFILSNNFRGNKTFKGLQQVNQCIKRLRRMNLDVALQQLKELCPNIFQRSLGLKAGECDVPSQPMLEWLCLKVLGAARLLSCTLNRCNRAFLLSKQQMKWEEFVILNVVITSMLSRFWVMYRGVLCCLSTIYKELLKLLREVANAQPMPFLTDFSLPADVAVFLGPSDALLLTKQTSINPKVKNLKKKMSSFLVKNQAQTTMVKEDLGVAVERGSDLNSDMKPFFKVFSNFKKAKLSQQKNKKGERKQKFNIQVAYTLKEVATFKDMATCLEEMILRCKSQKMRREKGLLTFLHLKCKRMKCLEAAGYDVQNRLKAFRKDACHCLSPQGPGPRSCRSSFAMGAISQLRTNFHLLRSRFKSSAVRNCMKTKWMKGEGEMTGLPKSGFRKKNGSKRELTSNTEKAEKHNDIDDIFATVGL